MQKYFLFYFCLFTSLFSLFSTDAINAKELTSKETLKLIKEVDERQRNTGDYKALCYMKENERKKEPKVYQLMIYRRDADDKLMILFTKPKEEAGKAYLRIDKNLWMFDPNTGKWDRRTERERIGGTNSRRGDFDESRLAEEYNIKYEGEGKLGKYKTHNIKLVAKKGMDVAYAMLKLSIDQKTKNILKREEYALSGKLLRTTYYPEWVKKYSSSKGSNVWIPKQMRIYDELEKGNSTIILIKDTDLKSLSKNIFTKAWIESKSR